MDDGCQCSEIAQCICDMAKIGEIEVMSGLTENINNLVSTELTSLASNCDSIFNCVNMDDLMTQEKNLNNDVTELLIDLGKACSNKLEELQGKLSSMRRQDSNYHEEQRRKHDHDDDDDD